MTQMQKQSQVIQAVRPILKRAGVTRSALFGSYARGEARTKSDVDILVSMPARADLLDFVRLKEALENRLKKQVDLVTFRSLSPFVKKYVVHDMVPII